MFRPRGFQRGKGYFTSAGLALVALCLSAGLPLRAVEDDGGAGNQAQQTAQDLSAQQVGSRPAGAAAAVPASAYRSLASAASSANATMTSTAQPAAAPPPAAPESKADWTPATAINSWLPHWLRISGEFRDREEGRTGYKFKPGADDGYGLTRARLGLDFIPSSWFHAFVQVRDSEVIGADPTHVTSSMKDVFDFNQAFIEFRNGEKGWFSLKTGRQELSFGDEHLIGRSNWSNATRSFDAVRLRLASDDVSWLGDIGARLDLFAGAVVKDYPTSWDAPQAGRDFYGVNVALTKIIPKATVEPYVYLKTVPSVTGADKKKGNERLYTSGVRLSGTLPYGFDYRLRYSVQSGHFADNSIHAWAGYGTLGYTIPGTRYQPRFSFEYNYASGNKAIGSSRVGTFDLLYPTTHQWDRVTDLFGEENIKDLKPGFDFRPAPKLKVRFVVSKLWLASRYDSLYDTTGAALVKVPKGGALSTDIGTEADLYGTYDVNRHLQLGAGFGHLYAGTFLKQNTPGSSSSYPYGFLDYRF